MYQIHKNNKPLGFVCPLSECLEVLAFIFHQTTYSVTVAQAVAAGYSIKAVNA